MANSCYFALFDIPAEFRLDEQALSRRYRELAKAVHPDRFMHAPERDQRMALAQSAQLNDAYETLKNPTRRALYLLSMYGPSLPLEATVQDAEFLMQQMQWREELEDLQESAEMAAIGPFKQRLQAHQSSLQTAFADCWNDAARREEAERLVRRMQFLDKLAQQVAQLEERLDDD